jgi:outer membrane receptor protein involved in Fe transport
MRKFLLLSTAAFVIGLCAIASLAQTSTTGEIVGVVTDANGAVVPNAQLTLSGPNMIVPKTAQADSEGRYRFEAVPPGKYDIGVAELSGFAASRQQNIEVNISHTTTVNITMSLKGANVSVDVNAAPLVDQVSNTTGTNITSEQFSNFPTARTVQGLYTIAPTVARSGLRDASGRDRDPSVAGSSGPENNYILDGVNATDPAFGGGGANLPFEFVQEIEIKTGAFGAEYGKSTGGIFNVITKSGGNDIRGDVFGYFTPKSFVRSVKPTALPFTGAAASGFSEIDAGFDVGGPIKKDKLWFFGAFNPQERKNYSLTQTFHQQVQNKVTTPFYAGKITWGISPKHTFTASTFGDFTKQTGFLFGGAGFGANLKSYTGTIETGGHNYAFRLNSAFSQHFIGEFSVGLHFQRANTLPDSTDTLVTDRFAVLQPNGSVVTPVETTVTNANGLRLAYVEGTGGTVQRNFVRQGFGLASEQKRNRREFAARFQSIWNAHTFKYGVEWMENLYNINTFSTGPNLTYTFAGTPTGPAGPQRVENRFAVCSRTSTTTITCPSASRTANVQLLIDAGQAPAGVTTAATGTVSISPTNPFLILDVVRARNFLLNTNGGYTTTHAEAFYIQDDWKITRDLSISAGLRWDYQQSNAVNGSSYLKLNNFKDNMQPRLGFIWDFTGQGRGKVFANYAKYVETPIPLDINVRAAGQGVQNDFNLNVSRLNGPTGSTCVDNDANPANGCGNNFGNLGADPTPVDPGLKPQTVREWTSGIEYSPMRDFVVGVTGRYRAQVDVIEDGSFDDGDHYFLFNPGRRAPGTTEAKACADPNIGCFGRARRYYRALEFTAQKRFSNNYQFVASYVFSSLIGNYEGLFRNDNGQSDPNITSLFDLVSLLRGMYGRLPNDRPHQFKFDGSYQWPMKLTTSVSFRAQSGIPFNALVPHPVYGDNEGFCIPGLSCVPRGTAINPFTGRNRTPTTWNLDFGAYYPIHVSEHKELRFTMDWFNVFNNQRAVRQDETFLINSGAPGINPVPNPFWGTGTIFQFPSSVRVGAKFSF